MYSAIYTKKTTPRQIPKKASVRGVDQFHTVPPGRFTSFVWNFAVWWYPIGLASRPFSEFLAENGLFSADARHKGRVRTG